MIFTPGLVTILMLRIHKSSIISYIFRGFDMTVQHKSD